MGSISLQIPQSGQLNSTEDPKIASDLTTIQTWANGNVDHTNLSSSAAIAQSQLAIGAWSGLNLNTNIFAPGTGYSPSARLYGDTVYLKGKIGTSAGITAPYTLATLPLSGMFPTQQVKFGLSAWSGTTGLIATGLGLTITTGGVLSTDTNLTTNVVIYLDGLIFTIS